MKKEAAESKKKVIANKIPKEEKAYLTKRLLVSAAKRGVRQAAEETMQLMGYNVIAKGGWVVKKYADGRIEKIEPINTSARQ